VQKNKIRNECYYRVSRNLLVVADRGWDGDVERGVGVAVTPETVERVGVLGVWVNTTSTVHAIKL
jgi:hypothetical protein